MQAALRQQGWLVNHKKVRRLMREHAGIVVTIYARIDDWKRGRR